MSAKYLIASRVPRRAATEIDAIARQVAHVTNRRTEPNRTTLPWHITFLPPQTDMDPEQLAYALKHIAIDAPRARLTLGRPTSFGREFIILPAHTSLGAARLWLALEESISRLPGFYAGPYLLENTLHVTLVEGLTMGFDLAGSRIERLLMKESSFDLESISLFEKPKGGTWSEVQKFLFIP